MLYDQEKQSVNASVRQDESKHVSVQFFVRHQKDYWFVRRFASSGNSKIKVSVSMERGWNDTDRGKSEIIRRKKNHSQCQCVNRKSHKDWAGIETDGGD